MYVHVRVCVRACCAAVVLHSGSDTATDACDSRILETLRARAAREGRNFCIMSTDIEVEEVDSTIHRRLLVRDAFAGPRLPRYNCAKCYCAHAPQLRDQMIPWARLGS